MSRKRSFGVAAVVVWAIKVRYAVPKQLNTASTEARIDLVRLLNSGLITHAEHARALVLIDNCFANRLYERLPRALRQALILPAPQPVEVIEP